MGFLKGFIEELLKTAQPNPRATARGRFQAQQQMASNMKSFAARGAQPASPAVSTPGQLSGASTKGMQSREAEMTAGGSASPPSTGKQITSQGVQSPNKLPAADNKPSGLNTPKPNTMTGGLAKPKPIAAGSTGQLTGGLQKQPALNKQKFTSPSAQKPYDPMGSDQSRKNVLGF